MESRNFNLLAAVFGFLGVALGAFGAHGLSAHFAAHPDLESTYHTAVQYQMYHALALVGAAWIVERYPGRAARWAGYLFATGIVLFSGSLYILSLFDVRIMGAVAPLGGVAFLGGWLCLGLAARRCSA
ncbi:MAG: DUF423 domain-containing protein [Anaerolineae bacterium]|nr:DUF423 domain-containing protein [Anaerolineae bacterium]